MDVSRTSPHFPDSIVKLLFPCETLVGDPKGYKLMSTYSEVAQSHCVHLSMIPYRKKIKLLLRFHTSDVPESLACGVICKTYKPHNYLLTFLVVTPSVTPGGSSLTDAVF